MWIAFALGALAGLRWLRYNVYFRSKQPIY